MGSIRRKLLFTLIFTELLAGIVAAWASFYTAQSQFDQFLDSELKQMATALAKRGNIPPSSLTLVGSNPEHRILVQVYESGSNSLFLSAKTSPSRFSSVRGSRTFSMREPPGASSRRPPVPKSLKSDSLSLSA